MGQQQLLLLVLGIVIVALAIVGGIFIFGENIKKTNADALVLDAINIANAAQSWKMRPTTFGGQSGAARDNPMDFSGFSLRAISLDEPYITPNGVFVVNGDSRGLVIEGANDELGNKVTMTVDGLTEQDIIAVVSNLNDLGGGFDAASQ